MQHELCWDVQVYRGYDTEHAVCDGCSCQIVMQPILVHTHVPVFSVPSCACLHQQPVHLNS